jgi:ABC-2 type transport system permease protein
MRRYIGLFFTQVRASLLVSLQYRGDFIIDGLIAAFRSLTVLVPLFVVYERASVPGWTYEEALLVGGWFTFLRGIIEGAISPSLTTVVDHIRRGTLDFVLLKPTDAQFQVSTARFEIWPVSRVIMALAIFVYAFQRMGQAPSLMGVTLAVALLASSTLLLYSLWILTVSAAFYVVKVDNLVYLFDSLFDAARWPATVFKGWLDILFTFVIPLAIMTTYPAEAMLGRLRYSAFFASLAGALIFATFARLVWLRALGRYTSASS